MEPLFGFLNIDKPLGKTSHDVVGMVRRYARNLTGKKVKVGHAGTLDPLATGVLVVCVGQATRLSEYVMHQTKRYRAHLKLGIATTTYDAEGDVTQQIDATHITADDLQRQFPQFTGTIAQLPPMYSAIKKDGKKLYELARDGQTVEIEPRQVTIHALTLIAWSMDDPTHPTATVDVTCGSGTYIRSLAHDLGAVLGVGGYLTGLRRVQSGSFIDSASIDLALLETSEDWRDFMIPPRVALTDWPVVQLDAVTLDAVQHGRNIPNIGAEAGTLARAHSPDDRFVAILIATDSEWRPHKVFLRES